MHIGDLVNYKNYVAIVTSTEPIKLALNTGETIECLSNEVFPLLSRSNVLELFENAIIGGCKQ